MTSPPNFDDLTLEVLRLRAENTELKQRRNFGLVWEDQPEGQIEKEMRENLPTLKHLKSLDIAGSVPSSNRPHILIEGDNLHALTVLQSTHKGAVDVIYIDPPYNTGKEFIYNDLIVTKEDDFRHSAWLSFMYKRLSLSRNLLAESGVILLSIDDNEQAHLRLLCDQTFGEGNFLGQFIWQKKYGGGNDSKHFVTEHEYVLAYAKNSSKAEAFLVGHNESYLKRYKEKDEFGRYFWDTLARPGLTGAIEVTLSDDEGSVTIMCGVSQSRAEQMYESGDIRIVRRGNGKPSVQFKQRLGGGMKKARSIIQKDKTGVGGTSDGKKTLSALVGDGVFDYPKPVELITFLLGAATRKPDALVLDFFAGAGTTANAVAQMNATDGGTRQCILVTNNENGICRTATLPRMRAVLSGQWADGESHDPLPGSLRFYTTEMLTKSRSRDAMRVKTAKALNDLLSVKEDAYTVLEQDDRHAILSSESKRVLAWTDPFDDTGLNEAIADLDADGSDVERVLYVASAGLFGVDQSFLDLVKENPDWRVEPVPEPFIREFEKAQALAGRKPR